MKKVLLSFLLLTLPLSANMAWAQTRGEAYQQDMVQIEDELDFEKEIENMQEFLVSTIKRLLEENRVEKTRAVLRQENDLVNGIETEISILQGWLSDVENTDIGEYSSLVAFRKMATSIQLREAIKKIRDEKEEDQTKRNLFEATVAQNPELQRKIEKLDEKIAEDENALSDLEALINQINALSETDIEQSLAALLVYESDIQEILNKRSSLCSTKGHLYLCDTNYDSIIRQNILANRVTTSGTETSLQRIFRGRVVRLANIMIGAIAVLYILVISAKIILAEGSDDDLSSAKGQLGMVIVGLIMVSIAEYIGFFIFDTRVDVIQGPAADNLYAKLQTVKTFVQIFIGAVMLITGGMTGYDLIVGAEDDETMAKEKRFFQAFFFGSFLILMAEVLIRVFSAATGYDTIGSTMGEENVAYGVSQFAGLINFILTFCGSVAVIMLIAASLYYVSSFGNEDQMERAKRTIIGTLVAIAVIFSSYVIANYFTTASFAS